VLDGDAISSRSILLSQNNFPKKHLSESVQDAAQHLPLRTLKGVRVETVSVTEIKDEL
jgi:hypothetical protein